MIVSISWTLPALECCVSYVFHYYLLYLGTKIRKFWSLFGFLFFFNFWISFFIFFFNFLASCVWFVFTLITIVYFDNEVKFLPFGYFPWEASELIGNLLVTWLSDRYIFNIYIYLVRNGKIRFLFQLRKIWDSLCLITCCLDLRNA